MIWMRIKCHTKLKVPKIYLIPTKTFASFHIECDSIQKERSPFDALEHVLFMVWLNWSFFGTLSQKCICKKDSFVWMLFLYLVTASHWTEGSLEMSLKQILFECSAGAEILKNCKHNSWTKLQMKFIALATQSKCESWNLLIDYKWNS